MTAADFIQAARAPATLYPQAFGQWTIERYKVDPGLIMGYAERRPAGFPSITILRHWSEETLLNGEVVMEDSRPELEQHLPIWLAARGRVLVTGLGLGCVARGLLASPRVEHVDVVEIDPGILRVVGAEFMSDPRITLHQGDARSYEFPPGTRWDFAWHDLCGERLQVVHAELMARFHEACPRQGAWAFPRHVARRIRGIVR